MIENGTARMVTTDGHRLAYIERNIGSPETDTAMDSLIPKKALTELTKISRGSER